MRTGGRTNGRPLAWSQKSKSFRKGHRPKGDGIYSVVSGNWLSHADFDGVRYWTLHEENEAVTGGWKGWKEGECGGWGSLVVRCCFHCCFVACPGCFRLLCATDRLWDPMAWRPCGATLKTAVHRDAARVSSALLVAKDAALPSDSRFREDLDFLRKDNKAGSQKRAGWC